MPAKPQGGDDDGFSTSPELSQIDEWWEHGVPKLDESWGRDRDEPRWRPFDWEEISKYFKEMVERGLITQEESEMLVRRLRRSRKMPDPLYEVARLYSEELEKLHARREAGLITQEEYEKQVERLSLQRQRLISSDVVRKLQERREAGLITQEEYEKQVDAILREFLDQETH